MGHSQLTVSWRFSCHPGQGLTQFMHSFLVVSISYHNTFRVIIALLPSHRCWDKNLPHFSGWVAARSWQPQNVGKPEERNIKLWVFLNVFWKALKLCTSLRLSVMQESISTQIGMFKKEITAFGLIRYI